MKTTTRKKFIKWKDTYYVRIYSLARQGLTNDEIVEKLGTNKMTLSKWRRKYPALEAALQQAREENQNRVQKTVRKMIYGRLPAHLKEVWDRINKCEDQGAGVERIEALLANDGREARQHIYLYALVERNFNASKACQAAGITSKELREWINEDSGFAELVDEMKWHIGNIYEEGLIQKVKDGDTACTIFANRTFNRDRGYNDKLQVEQNVNQQVQVTIDFDGLDLPLEVKVLVLEAVRKQKKLKDNPIMLEGEIVDKETK